MAIIPSFSDAPLKEGDSQYLAWGLNGKEDELSTLNKLQVTSHRSATFANCESRFDVSVLECWPSQESFRLHGGWLSRWACPIGEILNHEKLSEHRNRIKRWPLLRTSQFSNVLGGVASPSSILTIF